EADAMKRNGIAVGGKLIVPTIATVMLAGQDTVMENYIASRDPQGRAMHAFVAQIGELTSVLTQLTDNSIAGGQLKYRAIGESSYTTHNIMDYVDTGFRFRLPSFTIDAKTAPRG